MPSSGRDVIGDGKPRQLAINGPAIRFMLFRVSWSQTGLVSAAQSVEVTLSSHSYGQVPISSKL